MNDSPAWIVVIIHQYFPLSHVCSLSHCSIFLEWSGVANKNIVDVLGQRTGHPLKGPGYAI